MHKTVWITDQHFNIATEEVVRVFLRHLTRLGPDSVLLTGDVAESPNLERNLERIGQAARCPVYFVLGNHDFYFGSIADVRRRMTELCAGDPSLVYLTRRDDAIELTTGVGLVGHDGWADGRLGDYERSTVRMHDFTLIEELAGKNKAERWSVLKSLGDEAAAHARRMLPLVLERYETAFLITHVPPFREACWHEGRISDDFWLPHFTCEAMGAAILDIMSGRPDRRLVVLCGHTHGVGRARPLDNVTVLTGGATYGYPSVAGDFCPRKLAADP